MPSTIVTLFEPVFGMNRVPALIQHEHMRAVLTDPERPVDLVR